MEERIEFVRIQDVLPDLFRIAVKSAVRNRNSTPLIDEVDRTYVRSPAGLRSTQLLRSLHCEVQTANFSIQRRVIGLLGRHTVQFSRYGPLAGGPSGKEKRRAKSTGEHRSNLVLMRLRSAKALLSLRAPAKLKLSERMPTSISPKGLCNLPVLAPW
jgi:hypothetical protein